MRILRKFARWISWRPAYSALTNLSAVNTLDARYQKIGSKVVEFVLTFTATPVVEDFAQFNVALPVPTNLVNTTDLMAIASHGVVLFSANPDSNDITLGLIPAASNVTYSIRIQYVRQ